MKSKCNKIVIDKFEVSVPKRYKVKKRRLFLMNVLLYFLFLKRKIKKQFPELLKIGSPDFGSLKGKYCYEIKMGGHTLAFHTEIGESKPEDLADFIESGTKRRPILRDVTINDCYGKMYGDYSHIASCIQWWIKKDKCMIRFCFQGVGMPTTAIKDDVSDIINSLEYIEE